MGSQSPTGSADLCNQFHMNHAIFKGKTLVTIILYSKMYKIITLLDFRETELMVTLNTSVLMETGVVVVGGGGGSYIKPRYLQLKQRSPTH